MRPSTPVFLITQELCSRMSRIGLAPVLHQQKELSSLRSHYQHAFVRLIKIAQVVRKSS